MSIEIRAEGPLFDGRAQRAADRACEDARDDIAEYGEEIALREMGTFFRHPTGYYESRVITQVVSADTARVHDQGVVYGPWLAGVGSRNAPVTRFAGYPHWRIAKDAVKAAGPTMAERTVARHLPEMGG